jgi:hypothetical protein
MRVRCIQEKNDMSLFICQDLRFTLGIRPFFLCGRGYDETAPLVLSAMPSMNYRKMQNRANSRTESGRETLKHQPQQGV